MASVRKAQVAALKAMFGVGEDASEFVVPDWKILVFDKVGRSIISPLLNLSDLRSLGVTLHVLISAKRERIPDVPAVYFCMPTEENVAALCKDIKTHIYDSFQVNFITPVSRDLLEQLASACVEGGPSVTVSRVYDMYCNFISLEDDLFVLEDANSEIAGLSFDSLHDQEAEDAQIERYMDAVVDGLFCTFVTMGTVPIIRCSRRHAAEKIARELNKKFRDHFTNTRSTLFREGMSVTGSFSRPLLLLLDRHIDLATVMHHTWTYQALIHDLMTLRLNRVTVEERSTAGSETSSSAASSSKKVYDMEREDTFWHGNRGNPFPVVAEAVEQEIARYKEKEKEIRAQVGISDSTNLSAAMTDDTSKLASAVSSLPEILRQKERLDQHMALLTSIVAALKSRKLDDLFTVEEEIMNKKTLTRPVLDMLRDSEAGTAADKLRLYAVYYMDNDIPEEEEANCMQALEEMGCDMAPIRLLKSIKDMHKMSHQQPIAASHAGGLFSLANKTLSTGASLWKKGVKSLLPTPGDLPVARIASEAMELRSTKLTEDYLYFDPKQHHGGESTAVPKGRQPFETAVVFMVGGGNYTEYQNLVDHCKRSEGTKHIIYGVTQLTSADEYLEQFSRLGQKMSA